MSHLVEAPPGVCLSGAAEREEPLLPLVDLELVKCLMTLVFVVVEEGLDEVVVDDLRLPLEHPLLQVEGREMADLARLVQQRLHDPEEERAPESKEDMVSTFNLQRSAKGARGYVNEAGRLGK